MKTLGDGELNLLKIDSIFFWVIFLLSELMLGLGDIQMLYILQFPSYLMISRVTMCVVYNKIIIEKNLKLKVNTNI